MSEESCIKTQIVGDHDASLKYFRQGRSDLAEGGGIEDVGGPDAVNSLWAQISSRIYQGFPPVNDRDLPILVLDDVLNLVPLGGFTPPAIASSLVPSVDKARPSPLLGRINIWTAVK